MAAYISDKPVYSKHLDYQISKAVKKVVDLITLCKEIREPLQMASTYHQWYHYKNEFLEIYDALALVEHDVFLLAERVTEVSESIWKLYYVEHPEHTGEDQPVTDIED